MLVALEAQWHEAFRRTGVSPVKVPPLYIISGFRTPARNAEVDGAPDSRHIRCPSEAADLRVGQFAGGLGEREMWAILGGMWKLRGGRWGGDFTPTDFNHFDLG